MTLRDDWATISGTVRVSSDSAGGGTYKVVFLPAGEAGRLIATSAGPDGKFLQDNLAPGSYVAFAVRGKTPELAWREEQTVQQ